LSKSIDALIASMTASGPAAKRPPHIVFARVLSSMKPRRLHALPLAALIYTAVLGAATPAAAQTLDAAARAGIEALRAGDMRKLVVHPAPAPAPDVAFIGPDGAETTLAASDGKLRLVNFWATWCAPCREEMPALAALQASHGGSDFEVRLVATGRNSPEAIERFFSEENIVGLESGLDPASALARAMGVPGLPVTVVLNREGKEIARLVGEADWHGDSARAIVEALVAR
jgi:thiol-disulfide isomerase/thioredoxin